ncbi:glutamine synthetase family protein [Hydrogenophaga sp. PAMC20947]|uniref:glutamine synthetase family protein n=1 Tax=Hydrogenophaga sp. PAMC20947 TaxID=2565558 RepID=UPI00109DD021|nr:glutamine synthetase family protein [Hydrogenophaga sp. PAMC20947]QCB45749.1 glutamine synthetase [Hydrogenophaga sp. PAMC20947]
MIPTPPAFAAQCGVQDGAREAACLRACAAIEASNVDSVRLGWCDVHGQLRGKTLEPHAAIHALREGVGMVGTLMLKDTGDKTAWKVFEAGATADLPGFAGAANLMLLPDPESFTVLPWAQGTGWMRCQPWFQDGTPVALDSRRVLQNALDRLAASGHGLKTGLEVEFHIYRITDTTPQLDPKRAAWPGEPPTVEMIHPGYNLHAEALMDLAHEPLAIVRRTAKALGLPLQSLEIELGPSQVEAVFDATDALTAADHMVLFRNGVRQALRRAGYHASFMCRPPFPNIMSSGWHLHQSLVEQKTGRNAFVRASPEPGSHPDMACHTLSEIGTQWLAGLLDHARGITALCTPTINGFGRFQPNALAPQSVIWGQDNRGAMLRVVGGAGDPATRIENRIGEPAANPYLYIASQIHAGLDGMRRGLQAPPACDSPYAEGLERIPTTLSEALDALQSDAALTASLGPDFVRYFCQIKRSEVHRHAEASDPQAFERCEYFART